MISTIARVSNYIEWETDAITNERKAQSHGIKLSEFS